MLPQRQTQGLPTATTNSITYVFLITATAEIQQTSPPTTLHSVFSLLPSVSLEVVRGARVSYFVDEKTLGEILHNRSQPLQHSLASRAFLNQNISQHQNQNYGARA